MDYTFFEEIEIEEFHIRGTAQKYVLSYDNKKFEINQQSKDCIEKVKNLIKNNHQFMLKDYLSSLPDKEKTFLESLQSKL